MDDKQLLHYSRQIMLPEIGIDGQQCLLDANVLLIGVGGLGSPVALYLVAAGVGRMTLADFDTVDLSNLQRQIIHDFSGIGQTKVDSARTRLEKLNPSCNIRTITSVLDEAGLEEEVRQHDLVIDATDNFATRFLINRVCVKSRKPLVTGAAIRWEGQITCFTNRADSPCYHCLYPANGEDEETCTENGVLSPVVGIVGSIQATEAIKILTNTGTTLQNRLLILDALPMQWRTLKIKKDPDCPVCT